MLAGPLGTPPPDAAAGPRSCERIMELLGAGLPLVRLASFGSLAPGEGDELGLAAGVEAGSREFVLDSGLSVGEASEFSLFGEGSCEGLAAGVRSSLDEVGVALESFSILWSSLVATAAGGAGFAPAPTEVVCPADTNTGFIICPPGPRLPTATAPEKVITSDRLFLRSYPVRKSVPRTPATAVGVLIMNLLLLPSYFCSTLARTLPNFTLISTFFVPSALFSYFVMVMLESGDRFKTFLSFITTLARESFPDRRLSPAATFIPTRAATVELDAAWVTLISPLTTMRTPSLARVTVGAEIKAMQTLQRAI